MLVYVQLPFNHFWPLPFASRVMREATSIAIALPVLCELVWVWQRLCLLGDGCLACSCSVEAWSSRRPLETSLMG